MNDFLAEFFYSAIFWGTLVTGFLWWLHRKNPKGFVGAVIWLPLLWFGAHTAVAWYGFFLPPSGRLIDADSREPIKNSRVVATWRSYPLPIVWIDYCVGRQAHLVDSDGAFSFRFAPYPTLLVGSMWRTVDPAVPGRHTDRRNLPPLSAPTGDVLIRRLKPGGSQVLVEQSDYYCHFSFAPQYFYSAQERHKGLHFARVGLLPGEEHPFETTYREACIERHEATLAGNYMRGMMIVSRLTGRNLKSETPLLPIPPVVEQAFALPDPAQCPLGFGRCEDKVTPELRAQFCEYFAGIRKERGLKL
jgi:hypothetical protein